MSMNNDIVTYELNGAREIIEALGELPEKVQKSIIKSFLRKTGQEKIVKPLKTLVNYSAERESTIKVVQANDDKDAVQAGVTGKGYIIRWVDLGTKERKTKKGWSRGKIEGRKQIQPFIESQVEEVVDYFNENLGEEINKILERRLKRLRKKLG